MGLDAQHAGAQQPRVRQLPVAWKRTAQMELLAALPDELKGQVYSYLGRSPSAEAFEAAAGTWCLEDGRWRIVALLPQPVAGHVGPIRCLTCVRRVQGPGFERAHVLWDLTRHGEPTRSTYVRPGLSCALCAFWFSDCDGQYTEGSSSEED